eukprot:4925657-Pyramimonas_sp.AAC.1
MSDPREFVPFSGTARRLDGDGSAVPGSRQPTTPKAPPEDVISVHGSPDRDQDQVLQVDCDPNVSDMNIGLLASAIERIE